LGYFVSLVIALGLVLADHLGVFGRRGRTNPGPYRPDAAETLRNNAADLKTYHNTSFRVTYVVDGDTLDVDIPDKVRGKTTTRIRLWGVDTPETVKPGTPKQHFGPEASRFTKKFSLGKTVRLELIKTRNTRDRHGRVLAYVWVDSGREATCLNAELIAGGYGYCDPGFAHHRMDEYRTLQRQARESRAGLWAEVRDSDLPKYYRGKIELGQ